ncbi:MAG: hypothetical protein JSW07_04560 [bacterium]|nr:MAG: hypothetical protein JSW07_04560 [bacterium]
MMNIKYILFLITIFSFALSSISLAGDQQWQRISGSIFILYYQGNDLKNSQQILNSLQSSYLLLSEEIGVQLIDSVSVFITPSKKVFERIVGKNFPKWSDALAAPVKNTIILKSARWMPPETDNEAIAIHELTHIILDRAVKENPIPRWFNEGLAVYYSGEKGYASSTLVSKALVTNSIIPLSDIDEVLQFHVDKAQLAYQQSYLAVDYLFREFGNDAVKTIIHKMGEKLNLNQAFIEVIDLDLWEFEQQWYEHIKQKYRWHFLVEFDNYLWVLILALFVLGFIIIRRRNKRTIQRWQQEDENLA